MDTQRFKFKSVHAGFSLIELMIVVAIIGILAAVALPAYNGYITVTKNGVALTNAKSLAGFEQTYYYEYNTFVAGTYNPSTNTDTLSGALEWSPNGDNDSFSYVTAACSTNTINNCVDITVTYLADTSVTQTITVSP